MDFHNYCARLEMSHYQVIQTEPLFLGGLLIDFKQNILGKWVWEFSHNSYIYWYKFVFIVSITY